MPPRRRPPSARPPPKPAAAPSPFAAFSLKNSALDDLVEAAKLLRLDETGDAQFLAENERKAKLVETVKRGFGSAQRLQQMFPKTPLAPRSLTFTSLPDWPEWSNKHFKGEDTSYNAETAWIEKIRLPDGPIKSVGRTFDWAVSIREKVTLHMEGESQDAWAEVKMELARFAYNVDAYGPIVQLFEVDPSEAGHMLAPKLLVEVVGVKEVLPEVDREIGTRKTTAEERAAAQLLQKLPIIIFRFTIIAAKAVSDPATLRRIQARIGQGARGTVLTSSQLAHFIRLVLFNSSLLAPTYATHVNEDLPQDLRPHYGLSFLAPVRGVEHHVAVKVAGPKEHSTTACALQSCDKVDCKQMCSYCRSVYYCSPQHSTEHWPDHKTACRRHKAPAEFLSRARADGHVLIDLLNPDPIARYHWSIDRQTNKPANYDMQTLPKNVYGDQPFLIKMQRPVGFDYAPASMIYDRERSVLVRVGPQGTAASLWNKEREDFYKRLEAVAAACERWDGLKAYFYAYRIGDQLSVDLESLPDQNQSW